MNLKKIMLIARGQSQKVTQYRIPFLRNIQARQIHENRKQIAGMRRGRGRDCFVRVGVSLHGDGMFWNYIEVTGTQPVNVLSATDVRT